MATIEEALVTHLKASAPLSALIGNKIYAMHNPQRITLPSVTYQRVSTNRLSTHDEQTGGLASVRIQFDIYTESYATGLNISEAIRNALRGYRGTLSGVPVYAILPALEQHSDEPDVNYYRLTIDYIISYKE